MHSSLSKSHWPLVSSLFDPPVLCHAPALALELIPQSSNSSSISFPPNRTDTCARAATVSRDWTAKRTSTTARVCAWVASTARASMALTLSNAPATKDTREPFANWWVYLGLNSFLSNDRIKLDKVWGMTILLFDVILWSWIIDRDGAIVHRAH